MYEGGQGRNIDFIDKCDNKSKRQEKDNRNRHQLLTSANEALI